MKKIILIVLVAVILAAGAFYVSQPESSTAIVAPASSAIKPMASVVAPLIKPVTPTAKPVAPAASPAVVLDTKLIPPTPAPVVQAAKPLAENPAARSPRTELATTIPELARLIDAQDFETLMQDFMPPEELNLLLAKSGQPGPPMLLTELANRMSQNPKVMRQMEAASQFLKYLQTQTPTFDASGESASYPTRQVVNGQTSITFVKVDGNWYVKNGAQFFR
jgi:hypothetical protein